MNPSLSESGIETLVPSEDSCESGRPSPSLSPELESVSVSALGVVVPREVREEVEPEEVEDDELEEEELEEELVEELEEELEDVEEEEELEEELDEELVEDDEELEDELDDDARFARNDGSSTMTSSHPLNELPSTSRGRRAS